jgi:CPA1 family monovalent cation:H+ antiporter
VYLGWRSPEITNASMRMQVRPVWATIVFVLNGFIFILIGLQVSEILDGLAGYTTAQLAWYATLVSLAVILVRMIWVFPAAYLPRWLFTSIRKRDPYPPWQPLTIIGWTGMRGVVSLAAAMALPFTVDDGSPFPGRSLIQFLTITVIFVTLVIQGLSLPTLIRWLKVEDDGAAEAEELTARLKANQAALARLNEIAESRSIDTNTLQRMRAEYEDRIRQLELSEPADGQSERRLFSTDYEHLSRETLRVESDVILQLRNERVINDDVLRRIQRDIDLAEARLKRHG